MTLVSYQFIRTCTGLSVDVCFIHILSVFQNFYKEANKMIMPTGYTLPYDTPLNKQAKANSFITSNVREPQILKKQKEINVMIASHLMFQSL